MRCCRTHSARERKPGHAGVTRRRKIVLLALVALLLAALLLRWLMKPEHMAPAILDLAGKSLGLEITATGVGEYRLRGTPQLVVRNVTAREAGADTAVLQADRLLISVPWSTLRARGDDLTATRVELDAPILDVAAFQRWQAKRPPSDAPMPTLTKGVRIVRGVVIGQGWKIDGITADLQSLAAGKPIRSHLNGRYVSDGMTAPFDLHVAMTRPASGAGVGVVGEVNMDASEWTLPSHLRLSAKLQTTKGIRLEHALLGAHARYVSGDTSLPFALGIAAPLQINGNGMTLQPAALAVRGQDAIPTLDASGGFSLDDSMRLQLDGTLARWPDAWPTLPAPLGQSSAPLPFTLGYEGTSDLSGIAGLQLQRDQTDFAARFRLPEVMQWLDAVATGSPLPPMTGTLRTPALEVSGALLEGVEVEVEDESIPAIAPGQ
jgi:hypothetical protein